MDYSGYLCLKDQREETIGLPGGLQALSQERRVKPSLELPRLLLIYCPTLLTKLESRQEIALAMAMHPIQSRLQVRMCLYLYVLAVGGDLTSPGIELFQSYIF